MSEQDIIEALQHAVRDAVVSTSFQIPIKYLGRTFTIPDDQKWLEIVLIINNRTNETWGNERTFQGILRLILHWKNGDEGVYDPVAYLDEIAAYFTKNKVLEANVKVYDHPSLTSVIEAGQELLFPLSIPYRSFNV